MFKKSKIWGLTEELFCKNNVEIHRIEIKKGGYCSRHLHKSKFNMFFVESGVLEIRAKENDSNIVNSTVLSAGDMTTVEPEKTHMFLAKEETIAFEIYWVDLVKDDIVRENVGGVLKFEDDMYTGRYFRKRVKKVKRDEMDYANLMFNLFRPNVVYDVGCSLGSYLKEFKNNGCEVIGYDKYLDIARPYCDIGIVNDLVKHDAVSPIQVTKQSELTLCIELAEHIAPSYSADLIRNICEISNKDIVFVASGVGEKGSGHINCRDRNFWIAMFGSFGFSRNKIKETELTNKINSIGDTLNLSSNLIVFSKNGE